MEDKHEVARALLSPLYFGFNSSAHPLLSREEALLPLAGPFVSSSWCRDHQRGGTGPSVYCSSLKQKRSKEGVLAVLLEMV